VLFYSKNSKMVQKHLGGLPFSYTEIHDNTIAVRFWLSGQVFGLINVKIGLGTKLGLCYIEILTVGLIEV
jgi:hypothetical protein